MLIKPIIKSTLRAKSAILDKSLCIGLHTSVRDYANFGQSKGKNTLNSEFQNQDKFNGADQICEIFGNWNKANGDQFSLCQMNRLQRFEEGTNIDRLMSYEMAFGEWKAINPDIFCGVARCLNYISACLQIRRHKNLTKEVTPLRRIIEPLVRAA